MLAPVRERYGELRADEQALEAILREGAQRAIEIAADTLADVREHMGVGARSDPGAHRRERSVP
jgi:tryptophanyl-tRNA synthetase